MCLVAAVPAAGIPMEGILPGGTGSAQLQHVPRGLNVQLHKHLTKIQRQQLNTNANKFRTSVSKTGMYCTSPLFIHHVKAWMSLFD